MIKNETTLIRIKIKKKIKKTKFFKNKIRFFKIIKLNKIQLNKIN